MPALLEPPLTGTDIAPPKTRTGRWQGPTRLAKIIRLWKGRRLGSDWNSSDTLVRKDIHVRNLPPDGRFYTVSIPTGWCLDPPRLEEETGTQTLYDGDGVAHLIQHVNPEEAYLDILIPPPAGEKIR